MYKARGMAYSAPQGWIGYAGTRVLMFVHKLGLIKVIHFSTLPSRFSSF